MGAKAPHTPLIAALGLALLTVACSAKATPNRVGNPNLISAAEIEEGRTAGLRDLHELIERIRPRWLQIRNERSLRLQTSIAVYHNNARLGNAEALRGYPLAAITSIRYLDAAAAMQLPGAGSEHLEGAIVISTAIGRQ